MQTNNFTSLNAQEFKKELLGIGVVLLDVRTRMEQLQYGVISDEQVHIDISQPDAVIHIEELSKDEKYLIYCWHGVRSKQVMQYMQSLWFKYLNDLEGGIDIWNKH